MDLSPLQENYLLIAEAFAVILVVCYLSLIISKTTKTKAAPEASGAWPILGHFNLFAGSSQLPHIALASMADKYGPIFTVRLGLRKVLVVSNQEIAKEIFTTHDTIVSSRPKYLAAKILGYDYTMFGFTPYGPYWKEMRKIASQELLSIRRLELLKHIRVSEVEASIKEIYELWKEKKDSEGKVRVEMNKWFGELNLNVVLRMVAGKRYSRTTNVKDEEEMKRCRKVIREVFHFLGLFVVADMLPFLGWLDLGGHEKNMKRVAKEMDGIVEGWLDEHCRKRDSGKATKEQDFMDVIISVTENGALADYDADTVIKTTCMALIAGSAETTTVMLTWILSLLLNNPHALKKAHEELDMQVEKGRQVNDSDIKNLVYLQAIVKESLRLHPAGPLGGPREFSEDCTVAGYRVPKGTWLMVNLWKLHHDPEIWSSPSEFLPERFLTGTHKDIDVKGQDFELIPFGAGRRLCPGIAMGLQMLHSVLATLLHSFDMSTEGGEPVDMNETPGLTNVKTTPLEVFIAPRTTRKVPFRDGRKASQKVGKPY